MKSNRGFTIVELLVVMVVIAILVTITSVIFMGVLAQSRDTKRESDIQSISHALENYYQKHGEYPSNCDQAAYDTSAPHCPMQPLGFFAMPDGTPINSSTSTSGLIAAVPGVPDSVKDPRGTTTNVFGQLGNLASSSQFYYLYTGSMTNTQAGTVTGVDPYQNGISINGVTCSLRVDVPPNEPIAYTLSYYSETDSKLHVLVGAKGAKPYKADNSQPCVIANL